MATKFRILSIDGGGLRGIIPVLVLQEIERRSGGRRIHELFDLFAGTSTGGLIACALAASVDDKTPLLTLDQILAIYTEKGKDIFPQRNWLGNAVNKMVSLKRPEYDPAGLDKVLRDLLGKRRITDCIRPIFIPSYDLFNNEDVFFKSRHALTDPMANSELYDVCRATSAAPTYFPAYDCLYEGKRRTFIDGGMFMNNPALGAVVEVSKYHADPIYNRPELAFDDICVLSVGTGHYTPDIARKKVESWGILDWAKPVTDIMMQGMNQAVTYETEELLEDGNFMRLTLELINQNYARMDDSSPACRDYLIQETKNQILSNAALMAQLDHFIQSSLS
jgi:patatin-like phospholipase/acyl hydrolase